MVQLCSSVPSLLQPLHFFTSDQTPSKNLLVTHEKTVTCLGHRLQPNSFLLLSTLLLCCPFIPADHPCLFQKHMFHVLRTINTPSTQKSVAMVDKSSSTSKFSTSMERERERPTTQLGDEIHHISHTGRCIAATRSHLYIFFPHPRQHFLRTSHVLVPSHLGPQCCTACALPTLLFSSHQHESMTFLSSACSTCT